MTTRSPGGYRKRLNEANVTFSRRANHFGANECDLSTSFIWRHRLKGGHGQEAGRPAPCRSRTVRDSLRIIRLFSTGRPCHGHHAGSVYALWELEDHPLKLLPRLVLPRLSMPLGICHSDEAPTGSYTLDLTGSASAYRWH